MLKIFRCALGVSAALALLACGDVAEDGTDRGDSQAESLYAIMYEVFDDEASNSYLAFVDSLDAKSIDPSKSREFGGGRAYLQVYNGWLFIGEADKPIVHRYSVDARGALRGDKTISFAKYGLESGTIDPWSVTFISPTKAYLFDFEEGVHIIWDPTAMEIVGEIPRAAKFERAGKTLDGSPGVLRGNRLYRSVFWSDMVNDEYSDDQLLAIYDTDEDKLIETVSETRCPAPGNLAHKDEQDNIYFSNWIWPVANRVIADAPKGCVLRVAADADRFDADWTLPYAELADGHEGAMFTYLENNHGLISVFDETEIPPYEEGDDSWEYIAKEAWSIWDVDIEARTAQPIEGIPLNQGAYTPSVIDGRTFVLVPSDEWSRAQVYEIADGRGKPGIEIPGWSYAFVKVR